MYDFIIQKTTSKFGMINKFRQVSPLFSYFISSKLTYFTYYFFNYVLHFQFTLEITYICTCFHLKNVPCHNKYGQNPTKIPLNDLISFDFEPNAFSIDGHQKVLFFPQSGMLS